MTFGRILLTLITVSYCTLFTKWRHTKQMITTKVKSRDIGSTLLYKLYKGYSTRWSYRRNWKTCRFFFNTVHTNKRKNCIVTVFDPNTNHILLTRGIEIRNRYIKFVDVEKQVTNITMKDAPCLYSHVCTVICSSVLSCVCGVIFVFTIICAWSYDPLYSFVCILICSSLLSCVDGVMFLFTFMCVRC